MSITKCWLFKNKISLDLVMNFNFLFIIFSDKIYFIYVIIIIFGFRSRI